MGEEQFHALDIARSRSDGQHIDTDGDGLTDEEETQLKTCPLDEDTDGDGVSDAVELKLAFDPLTKDDRIECVDLLSTQEQGDAPCSPGVTKTWRRYDDKDGDGQLSSSERQVMRDTLRQRASQPARDGDKPARTGESTGSSGTSPDGARTVRPEGSR